MSEDLPTTPAPKRRSLSPEAAAKIFGTVKEAGKLLVTIGGACIALYRWIETRADKGYVDQRDKVCLDALADEAEARRAQGVELDRQRAEKDELRRALLESYLRDVGEKAAEIEPDARKRARVAERARDRFEGYFREGMPMDEAFRRALARGVP